MAARLLSPKKWVIYGSSLSKQVNNNSFKAFSSRSDKGKTSYVVIDEIEEGNGTKTVWTNRKNDLLGPQDRRLPLPGNIGLCHKLKTPVAPSVLTTKEKPSDVVSTTTNYEHHVEVLQQIPNAATDREIEECLLETMPSEGMECVAQECPQLLRKEFINLFLGMDFCDGPMTVVTLSQKTDNDMSGWSQNVETEREQLTEYFVLAAGEICSRLKDQGFWADFIDPCSGRPYLGPYTNATLFETDERYSRLGFHIEDLGCCKVVSHHKWATHVFVGSIFTNATYDSPVLSDILQQLRTQD